LITSGLPGIRQIRAIPEFPDFKNYAASGEVCSGDKGDTRGQRMGPLVEESDHVWSRETGDLSERAGFRNLRYLLLFLYEDDGGKFGDNGTQSFAKKRRHRSFAPGNSLTK
jgi:hypothetical protein